MAQTVPQTSVYGLLSFFLEELCIVGGESATEPFGERESRFMDLLGTVVGVRNIHSIHARRKQLAAEDAQSNIHYALAGVKEGVIISRRRCISYTYRVPHLPSYSTLIPVALRYISPAMKRQNRQDRNKRSKIARRRRELRYSISP